MLAASPHGLPSPWPLITRDPGSALSPGSPSPGTSSLLSAREAVPSVRPTPRSGFLPPVFVMGSEISLPLVLHVGARGKGSPAGSRRCVCVVGDGGAQQLHWSKTGFPAESWPLELQRRGAGLLERERERKLSHTTRTHTHTNINNII